MAKIVRATAESLTQQEKRKVRENSQRERNPGSEKSSLKMQSEKQIRERKDLEFKSMAVENGKGELKSSQRIVLRGGFLQCGRGPAASAPPGS